MPYKVAGIDVHKSVLIVVVATAGDQVEDAAGETLTFECRRFGAGAAERQHLVGWLQQRNVHEVVMESTAQYWKPIWLELEPHFPRLQLAQAQSNRAPKGRKHDFADAKRLTRRLLCGELMLSFVPDAEQRSWRMMTRGKHQLVRDRVRLQNQVEALLEEARIKLSSVVSELLGMSGRRILQAMADGETDAERLAKLGDRRLRCSLEELADALRGDLQPLPRTLLGLHLQRLALLDQQIAALDQLVAAALNKHEEAVIRLAAVPGFGADSAQQIIAEMGVDAEAFPSAAQFSSWAGLCPGRQESAETNYSAQSAKGNRFVRRILVQAAQAAVKKKGSHFQKVFRKLLYKHSFPQALWAVAHRLGRLVWKILHDRISYVEQGEETDPRSRSYRAKKLVKSLQALGYRVTLEAVDPVLRANAAG